MDIRGKYNSKVRFDRRPFYLGPLSFVSNAVQCLLVSPLPKLLFFKKSLEGLAGTVAFATKYSEGN